MSSNLAICCNHTQKKIARSHVLESIVTCCHTGLWGTGTQTSNRAKRWYWWFAAIAAKGYSTVEGSLGELAHMQGLAIGQPQSIATARRAIAELEQLGYVRRRSFRPRGVSMIDINLEKFTWYIKKYRELPSPPVGTYTHTDLPHSFCYPDEFTNYSGVVETPSIDVTTSCKSKKPAKKRKTFAEWSHPLVFTIGVLLWDRGRAHRERLQAACELAIAEQVEPFAYWTAERFQEMSIPVREQTARRLLPELREYALRCREESPPPGRTESPPNRRKESPPPTEHLPPPEEPPPPPDELTPFLQGFVERMGLDTALK